MPTPRQKKTVAPQEQGPPSGDPALNLILQQLELIQQQQRLQALSLSELKETQDRNTLQLHQQLVKDKRAAEDGLKAAMEAMYKHIEQQPKSWADVQAQIAQAQKQAEQQAADKRARFTEELKLQTRGDVINLSGETVPLTINGVLITIKPGLNKEIPASFIALWEDNFEMQQQGAARLRTIENKVVPFGSLEDWRADPTQISYSFDRSSYQEG